MAFVNRGLLGLVLLALMAYMQLTCAMGEETPTKAAVQDAGKAVAAEPATEAVSAVLRRLTSVETCISSTTTRQ